MTNQEAIIAEGRVCYRLGFPATHPSGQFKDHDLTLDWANGWRWEREAHEQRTPPCECKGCQRHRSGL